MCTHVPMYVCTCAYVCVHMCLCMCARVCAHVPMYVCMCAYVCVYVHIHVCQSVALVQLFVPRTVIRTIRKVRWSVDNNYFLKVRTFIPSKIAICCTLYVRLSGHYWFLGVFVCMYVFVCVCMCVCVCVVCCRVKMITFFQYLHVGI